MSEKKLESKALGVGLDAGTMNIVSARRADKGVATKRVRDAFLELPAEAKRMLKLSGVSYVEREDELLILGDPALETANVFGREVRRPLSAGLISPTDSDAIDVLALLIKSVLGDPTEPGEHCYVSVPAAPIDRPGHDVVYHRGVLEKVVAACGYTPTAANEAMAVIFAETAKDNFSGIGISFGSGMTNCALSLNSVEGLSFSVARGGDWIDTGAAKALGVSAARMCATKEKGIDLNAPAGREQEALVFYYKNLVEYAIDAIAAQFKLIEAKFTVPRAIPLVISGGTAKAGGFLEFFTAAFERKRKRFPVQISEVRMAADPLNAVAQGLLIQASQEYE